MSSVMQIPVSRQHAQRPSTEPRALLPTADATMAVVERVFAETVEGHVHEGILCYSDRLKLLRTAQRLHIERFRANLIIALVQRQSQTTRPKMRMAADSAMTPRRWKITSVLGIVLLVEAATAASVCWALRLF
jgi:hypothetical protein